MKRLIPLPLLLLVLLPSAQAWQKPKTDPPPDVVIHLPPIPKPPDPPAPPQPKPGAAVALPTGKLLLITAPAVKDDKGSIIDLDPKDRLNINWIARDGSDVSIKSMKGPVTIYGDFVDPQPTDDDGRVINDAYIYIIRAKVAGQGTLVLVSYRVGGASRVTNQAADVGGTPPSPVTVSVSPTTATVPTGGKQQFVGTASQGGVTWKSSGVGSVGTSGMFLAGSISGSATIVAISTVDSSKTAVATVMVTDQPPPNPAPIPVAGFRVLMLYSVKDEETYPPAQQAILYDKSIRDYLASKCVKGGDGTPERRIWDAGVDASAESTIWQNALKRDHKQLPWIIISDGKTGFEGPLPSNVADTLTLLKKYGGA